MFAFSSYKDFNVLRDIIHCSRNWIGI